MSGSTSSNLEVVAGFGGDCEAVALLSVAGKKTPTLPGQWSVPELQAEEKIAVYNRQKSAGAHLKMLDVSRSVPCMQVIGCIVVRVYFYSCKQLVMSKCEIKVWTVNAAIIYAR